jgi:hypothetical protein
VDRRIAERLLANAVERLEAEQVRREFVEPEIDGRVVKPGELRRADLRRYDFSVADLFAMALSQCDAEGVKFTLANVMLADFQGANLVGADFTGAKAGLHTNFRGADLTRANLSAATLEESDFRRANLTEANLRGALLCVGYYPAALSPIRMGWRRGGYFTGGRGSMDTLPNMTIDLEGAALRGADFGPLVLVGRVSIGQDFREIFLWTSVLGGLVVHIGFLVFEVEDFCQMAEREGELGRAAVSAVRYLQTLVPLAVARRSRELGLIQLGRELRASQ